MQKVSQKWIDTNNEKFLPPQSISVSFYNTDNDVKGYTDTTFTTSALGKVNTMGAVVDYNIYFDGGETLYGKRLSIVWQSDGSYIIGGKIYLLDNTFDDTEPVPITGIIWEREFNQNGKTLDVEIPKTDKTYKIYIYAMAYNSNLGIDTINIEKYVTFSDDELIDAEFSQSGDLLSFALPETSFTFNLNNVDGIYNPDNPNNNLSALDNHELIYVDITQYYPDNELSYQITQETTLEEIIEIVNIEHPTYKYVRTNETANGEFAIFWNTETIKGGEYFIEGWDVPQNGITALFSARDGIQFMQKKNSFTQTTPQYEDKYGEVESITSNGTGYIDTKYAFDNSKYSREIHCVFSTPDNNDKCIFGANDGTYSFSFEVENGYFVAKCNGKSLRTYQVNANKTYEFYVLITVFQANNQEIASQRVYIYGYEGENTHNDWALSYYGTDALIGLPEKKNLYIGAYNNNGTATRKGAVTFTQNYWDNTPVFYISEYGTDDCYVKLVPVMYVNGNTYGFYDTARNLYLQGNDFTGFNLKNKLSLYNTAEFAFINSEIPSNPQNNTTRYSDISRELDKYVNMADLTQLDQTYAETVQYCCNAAKCIWYWDRNCQSHIIPFTLAKQIMPEEYVRCNYIKYPNNNNGAYIDLGFEPGTHTLYLSFMYENYSGEKRIFGTPNSGASNNYCLTQVANSNKWYAGLHSAQQSFGNPQNQIGKKINLVFNGLQNHKIAMNDETYIDGLEAWAYGNLHLGGYVNSYTFDGYVYSCSVVNYYTNKLIRDLIPCIRKSDGKCGLYDFVNNVFYYNNGTGELTCNYNYLGYVADEEALPDDDNEYNDLYITADKNIAYYWDGEKWVAIVEDLENYSYKGTVNTISNLPDEGNQKYDVYEIKNNTTLYYWDGEKWEELKSDIGTYIIDRNNSYNSANYSMTEDLAAVDVNNGMAIYRIKDEGVIQTVDNPFVTDADHAFDVARWIGDNLRLRKSLDGEFRPDVRLDIYDKIIVQNKYAVHNIYTTSVKYSYSGAFKGNYTGKATSN